MNGRYLPNKGKDSLESLYFYRNSNLTKMARTPTIEIELGYSAPDFLLPDTISGNNFSYSDLKGENGTVVFFICNHCPFVVHVIEEIVNVGNDFMKNGIGFVVISSNDVVNYPEDSTENMKLFAEKHNFPFPYLYDKTQEIAKAYTAACTPDLSVFDKNDKCIYRGQLDDARPGNSAPSNGKDLRRALNYLLTGKELDFNQKPSIGCGIKWK